MMIHVVKIDPVDKLSEVVVSLGWIVQIIRYTISQRITSQAHQVLLKFKNTRIKVLTAQSLCNPKAKVHKARLW